MNRFYKRALSLGLVVSMLGGSVSFAAPSEIHGHMPLSYFDYFLTNYNEDGEIRVKPASASFDLEEVEKPTDSKIPTITSEPTDYGSDVVLKIEGGKEKTQWFNNVYKVTIVPDLGNPNKETQVAFDFNNDEIVLKSDSRGIDYNKKMLIKVYSNGFEPVKHLIHIVKDAPRILLSSGEPRAYAPVILNLENFNYAITNPVQALYIDGEKVEQFPQSEDGKWHIVSNVVRIYENVIKTPGRHTIKMEFDGFKTAEATFTFGQGEPWPEKEKSTDLQAHITPDLLAAASGGISIGGDSGGSSGSGGSGGGMAISANVIFDFDLISNAMILREAGLETPESKAVIDVWEKSIIDSAKMDGSERRVDWAAYQTAAEKAKLEGQYLAFEDYYNSPDSKDISGKPYKVKYVLEDGKYGEAIYYNEIDLLPAGSLTFDSKSYKFGDDVKLNFTKPEWAKAIEFIKVGRMVVQFEVKNNTIQIPGNYFTGGKTDIEIEAKGYHKAKYSVNIEKTNIDAKLDVTPKAGQSALVNGLSQDFLDNLLDVKLNGDDILPGNAVGGLGDYTKMGNQIRINSTAITKPGTYVLTMKAEGYEEVIVRFYVEESDGSTVEKVTPIAPASVSGNPDNNMSIPLQKLNDGWKKDISKVILVTNNYETALTGDKYTITDNAIVIDKSVLSVNSTKLIIKALGHSDVSINLDIKHTMELRPFLANSEHGLVWDIKLSGGYLDEEDLKITLNGKVLAPDSFKLKTSQLIIPKASLALETAFVGKIEIADYETKSFNVNLAETTGSNVVTGVRLKADPSQGQVLQLETSEADWVKAIKSVKVNDKAIDVLTFVDYENNLLKIERAADTIGPAQLVIEADGYQNLLVDFTVMGQALKMEVENKAYFLTNEDIKLKDTALLTSKFSEWSKAVTKVTLDEKTVSSSDYSIVDNRLVLKGSLFTEVKKYNLVIDANGFGQVKVETPQFVTNLPAPSKMFADTYYHTEDIVIGRGDWAQKITEFKVVPENGSPYTIDLSNIKDDSSNGRTVIDGRAFNDKGNITFEVKSGRYEVYTQKIQLKTPLDAPETVRFEGGAEHSTKDEVRIDTPVVATPVYTVYDIKVDGQSLDQSMYIVESSTVKLPAGVMTPGDKIVTLMAKGYKDKNLSLKVVDGGSLPTLKTAPAVTLVGDVVSGNEITFTYTNANNWKESITEVVVKDNKEKADYIKYETGKLVFPRAAASYKGDYSITIKADGFKDVTLDYSVVDEMPEYEVNGHKMVGKSISIDKAGSFNFSFATWITEAKKGITVKYNDVLVPSDKVNVTSNNVVIDGSVFTQTGSQKITVIVPGYEKLVKSVVFAPAGNITPETMKPVSTSLKVGDDVVIKTSGDYKLFTAWLKENLTVKVNGSTVADENIEKTTNSSSYNELTIKAAAFTTTGDHTVVISAPGYSELTYSVKLNGRNAGTLKFNDSKPLKKGSDVVLAINYDDDPREWLKMDLSIQINDVDVDKSKVAISIGSYKSSTHTLTFDSSLFQNYDDYKIVIKAPNYEDETFQFTLALIEVGRLEIDERTPEIGKAVTVQTYSSSDKDKLEDMFTDNLKVYVDGKLIDASKYETGKTSRFFGKAFIKIDESVFNNSGLTTIKISSDNYKGQSVTFTMTGTPSVTSGGAITID